MGCLFTTHALLEWKVTRGVLLTGSGVFLKSAMDFDLILDYLGHFGKFQCFVMLLSGIAQIFGGMQTHSSRFVVFGNDRLRSR